MDRAQLVARAAARVWSEHQARAGDFALSTDPRALIARLADLAETLYDLTVADDPAMVGTNIEGELNADASTILYRPDLSPARAAFVIAHELGHFVLKHPAHEIMADTTSQIDPEIRPDDLDLSRQQAISGLELTDAILAGLRGYSPKDRWEREANAFASELLTPSASLRERLFSDPSLRVETLAQNLSVPAGQIRRGLVSALLTARNAAPEPRTTEAETSGPPGLDESQRRAVEISAPARIVAGPGAGKTRVLVERYARLVNNGVEPRKILALTFANRAAGEMRERLAKLVGPENAGAVDVATFHAFGFQLLQEYGHHLGLKQPVRLLTPLDAFLLVRPTLSKMPLGSYAQLWKVAKNVRELIAAISRARDEDVTPADWLAAATTDAERDAGEFFAAYEALLRENDCLDYADLITSTLRLLELPDVGAEIRARYEHVLVDEFQDINYSSGKLVRALDCGRGIVWAVGDPRQSIYGFRGASPVNLGRFTDPEYYPNASTVSLDGNYRSVADIVAAGSAVPIPLPPDPKIVPPPLIAHRGQTDPKPAVHCATFPNALAEADGIASRVARMAESGTPLSDIAILCRKTAHAGRIADALNASGIAHTWGGKLEGRPLFKVLMSALLLALDDPRGIAGLTRIEPLSGIDTGGRVGRIEMSEADRRVLFATRIRSARRLLDTAIRGEIAGLSPDGVAACRKLLATIERLSPTARAHHNLSVHLFECADWFPALLDPIVRETFPGRRALATLGQIFDIAAAFAQRQSPGVDVSTGAFVDYIEAALSSGGLDVPGNLDPGGDAVSILTVHRSKGLEWPIVFVPCVANREFPTDERNTGIALPAGLSHELAGDGASSHDREEACLFYVALTRAKDRLIVTRAEKYPRGRMSPPETLLAVLDTLRAAGRLTEETVDAVSGRGEDDRASPSDDPERIGLVVGETIDDHALTAYDGCPRRYLMEYGYNLASPERAMRDFYRVVHAVIGEASTAGSAPGAPRWREILERTWAESGPVPGHWQEPFFRRAAEKLLVRKLDAASDTIAIGAIRRRQKRRVEIGETADGRVRGVGIVVDEEVVGPDGARTFRRSKLVGSGSGKSDDHRTVLFGLLAQQSGTGARAVIHHAETDIETPIEVSARLKSNRVKKYREIIENIEAGEFPMKPTRDCERCAFQLICAADPDE